MEDTAQPKESTATIDIDASVGSPYTIKLNARAVDVAVSAPVRLDSPELHIPENKRALERRLMDRESLVQDVCVGAALTEALVKAVDVDTVSVPKSMLIELRDLVTRLCGSFEDDLPPVK